MIAFLLALAVMGALQETAEDVVRQLEADSIEVREAASEKLIRMGVSAREALAKAVASKDPEVRARAERILKTIEVLRDVRSWLAPPSRITMSGEFTLEEAARELSRQSGQKIEGDPWPAGKFRIDLKDAPCWDALEAIGAASGARTPAVTENGVQFAGARYLKKPRVDQGSLTLRLDSLEVGREFQIFDKTEKRILAVGLAVGWERALAPACHYIDVQVAKDDQGFDLKPGFKAFEDSTTSGLAVSGEDPPTKFGETFYLATHDPPPETAVSITLAGKFVLWLRGSAENLEMALPPPHEDPDAEVPETRDSLRVFDSQLIKYHDVKVVLTGGRADSGVSGLLRLEGVDPRMFRNHTYLAFVADTKGRRYPGHVMWEAERKGFSLWFGDMPEDAKVERVSLRIPRRVVQVEIPFSLKDIQVK